MKEDEYTNRWVLAIQQAGNDKQRLAEIVNKIYEDGFEDGTNAPA